MIMKNKSDNRIDVWFYNENDKPFAIGEKMCAINEKAYMNGYNWDIFFNYYLAKNAPDILERYLLRIGLNIRKCQSGINEF